MRSFLFTARVPLALIVTILLMASLAIHAPQQLPVVHYKALLVCLGGLAGYWLDRVLFPYADPAGYLCADWRGTPDADRLGDADYPVVQDYRRVFGLAMLRQAGLVAAGMLGVGLGL